MELFARRGLHPRTDLGQNFLIDLNILDFVVREAHLEPRDVVLEVGAGTGGMTAFLSDRAGAVVSVEVDRTMYSLASEVVEGRGNVTLMRCDALKNKNRMNPDVLAKVREKLDEVPEARLKLVANLPYSIATPVVSMLAGSDLPWSRMVAMIQLELAEKMVAKPKTSDYGALSAWLQIVAGVKLLKRVPPQVFWPRPQVNSAVIRLNPNPRGRATVDDLDFYRDFVRRLFHHRRKLMRGVIAGMYRKQIDKDAVDAALTSCGMGPTARAEEQAPKTLVYLANRLREEVLAAEGSSHVTTGEEE